MTPDQDIIALAETCMGVPQTVPALDQHEDYEVFVALPEEVIAFAREIRNAALEEAAKSADEYADLTVYDGFKAGAQVAAANPATVLAMIQLIEECRVALASIAGNTCCDNCREAALVARNPLQSIENFGRKG